MFFYVIWNIIVTYLVLTTSSLFTFPSSSKFRKHSHINYIKFQTLYYAYVCYRIKQWDEVYDEIA